MKAFTWRAYALATFVLALVGYCVFVLTFPIFGGCEDRLIQTIPAPQGANTAVLFERNCGATEGYATKVAITHGVQKEKLDRWVVLDIDGRARVTIRWLSSSQLQLSVPATARIEKFVALRGDSEVVLIRANPGANH